MPPSRTYAEIRREDEVDETIDRVLRDHGSFLQLGFARPQGGAPLGDHDRRDVVRPDFRVRGFDNLFVCDASPFPVSVRVNPMVGIMAVADRAVDPIGGFRPEARIEEGHAWEDRTRAATVRR